jgi:hypothetical protein
MGRVLRVMGLVMLMTVSTACGGEAASHSAAQGHHAGGAAMNMGDSNATAADEVPGAALARGSFRLLDTAPEGYQDVSGTATLAPHGGGTTVTVELRGLKPNVPFISHGHQGSCAEGGGEHYKFEPAGGDVPPNEIHLAFTSTSEGTGYMTAENDRLVGPQAQSVVVHPSEFIDNRIACAALS